MSLVTISPLPSGSQSGSDTPSARLVTRRASPPAIDNTQSWGPFCRVETNASVVPSGDQRGWRSGPGASLSPPGLPGGPPAPPDPPPAPVGLGGGAGGRGPGPPPPGGGGRIGPPLRAR